MDPEILAQVLRSTAKYFQQFNDPAILVGLNGADDAGVYQINDDLAIINTLDFFTPIVDDPYDFGAIAAANATSDVFAMGGEVVFALNICAFPPQLDQAVISEILHGGADKIFEAGGSIIGGHTIQDKEPKYGMAVTGFVHPRRIFTKGGAMPGDVLVLTKPLGSGTVSTAVKRELADPGHEQEMIRWMKQLNKTAASAGQAANVKCATDITGYSFLGHAYEMVFSSSVQFVISFDQIPFLTGAKTYAKDWIFPGGSHKNKEYYKSYVQMDDSIPPEWQMLLYDAQTSGGLLLAIPEKNVDAFTAVMQQNSGNYWIVGKVQPGSGIIVKETT